MFLFMIIFVIASGKPPAPIWKDFKVISGSMLGSFGQFLLQMLQNSKNATFSSNLLGLGGAGPPFLHDFCKLFECVFYVAV